MRLRDCWGPRASVSFDEESLAEQSKLSRLRRRRRRVLDTLSALMPLIAALIILASFMVPLPQSLLSKSSKSSKSSSSSSSSWRSSNRSPTPPRRRGAGRTRNRPMSPWRKTKPHLILDAAAARMWEDRATANAVEFYRVLISKTALMPSSKETKKCLIDKEYTKTLTDVVFEVVNVQITGTFQITFGRSVCSCNPLTMA